LYQTRLPGGGNHAAMRTCGQKKSDAVGAAQLDCQERRSAYLDNRTLQ